MERVSKKDLLTRGHTFNSVVFIRAMMAANNNEEAFASVAGSDDIEVCLQVNGYEIPFLKALLTLDKHYDVEVERRAKELVQERFGEALQKIDEAADDAIKTFSRRLSIPGDLDRKRFAAAERSFWSETNNLSVSECGPWEPNPETSSWSRDLRLADGTEMHAVVSFESGSAKIERSYLY